jgi:hypothetical protein
MKIKNNRNKANCVNFKDNGFPIKVMINAGATVEISSLNNVSQIINYGDFNRGFFEVVEEVKPEVEVKKSTPKKKDKEEDSLKKIEKEVKDYTDKE